MNLINEYRNNYDKIDFFRSLSNNDKIELYKKMYKEEQQQLLFILPFQYIKNFIQILEKQDKKEIYKNLKETQLKAIYKTLNQEEQKEMASTLDEIQMDWMNNISTSRTNIINSSNSIRNAEDKIQTSTANLANTKIELQIQNQNLKQNKVTIKNLTQERKRDLKKVMRASRPSILDRIGIISKHRTKKLIQATEKLERTNLNIETAITQEEQIQQEINNLQTTIKQEYQNIKSSKNQIQQSKQNIHENTKKIKETETSIRHLSQTEKRVLGRKMYHKTINERNIVASRRKRNTLEGPQTLSEPIIENKEVVIMETPTVEVFDTQKKDTQESMNQVINAARDLNGIGVNFYPPANIIHPIQSGNLTEDPIMNITRSNLVIATYAMMAFYNYLLLQQQTRVQQSQNLSEGYQRRLTPNNRGVVNFTLLMSIILFIF